MISVIKLRFTEWLIAFILRYIVLGGHCGCCGAWVGHDLCARYWRVTVCDKCLKFAHDYDEVVSTPPGESTAVK